MKKIYLLLCLFFLTNSVRAQNVTLDLKDAPVKSALEQVFKQSKKQYSIDNQVNGFVTMSITDQPFENALKSIFRASSLPLTYSLENNVYFVKLRQILPTTNTQTVIEKKEFINNFSFERIPLIYIDPADLRLIFGNFLNNRQFTRFGFGFGFNQGGQNNMGK